MNKSKIFLGSMVLGMFILSNTALALVNQPAIFSDVNSQTDYATSINWAVSNGIATGYQNGNWGPNDCVTRAQLLKMVTEAQMLPYSSDPDYSPSPFVPDFAITFKDVKKTDWFYQYVYEAKEAGNINGYSDGTFKPNNCVNRAEAMKIAANIMFSNPQLDTSGGPIMYDDKIIGDIQMGDWFRGYARLLFRDRLVGTNHTVHVGEIGGAPVINFFPEQNMSRKEVAEMLHSISISPTFTDLFRPEN